MNTLQRGVRLACLLLVTTLASCSMFSSKKPRIEPAPLVNFKPSLTVRTLWQADLGRAGTPFLAPVFTDGKVYAAGSDGKVVALDAASGRQVWSVTVDADIAAGVGADAATVVVASARGTVFAFDAATGKQRWKVKASTEVLSAPAVGSGVVVVRSMDNKIVAYDVESGERRWVVQRTAPALVLRAAPGIVINDGVAFIALPAGRLLAINTATGTARWDAPIAEPRGATELERVADVSGMPALLGREVCATAYQGRIACVDTGNGSLRWAREFSADVGPAIDQRYVFAADELGSLAGFSRDTGGSLWRSTALRGRGLSAPVSFGRAVVVGDKQGYLHFLSREEGAMLARTSMGAQLRAAPIVTGANLVVQTVEGKLIALTTE
ncbi:MAG: outer membrane protein assembly factor BamB [Pseudomonadota bacterium]|jgi:outer membrane protein assembly factor BamB